MRNGSHNALESPANAILSTSNVLYIFLSDFVVSCQRKWFLSKVLVLLEVADVMSVMLLAIALR